MFNSDDDFPDDFVLDDQTLAILDKEESRFEETKHASEPDAEDLPPAKRQKLDIGPPRNLSVFSHSPDDTEHLPDITVCSDDTYVAKPQHITSTPQAGKVNQSPAADFAKHLTCLRKQKNELHKDKVRLQEDNVRLQEELRCTLSAKLAKEGEVVILRKNIEKIAQDHAAQTAKLRAAKEEAEAKQTQMQKEMKEEAERLKTLFTFKQHEIETSTRKSPWWNQSGAVAGPSRVVQESPTRPRFGEIANSERTRKPVSRVTDSRKGKCKAPDLNLSGPLKAQFDSGLPPASLPFGGVQTNLFQAVQDDGSGATAQEDVFMADSNMTDGVQDPQIQGTVDEEIEEMEPHRWIVDLHQLVLMHMEPTCRMTTFHALLGVSLPIGPKSDAYTFACSRILDVLASVPAQEHQAWELAAQAICGALTEMADMLAASNHITTLTALFSQLTQITYTLPTPHPYLLVDNTTDPEEDGIPRILAVICSIIQNHVSKLENHETEKSELGLLAKESLALLEALCWNTPSDLENRLALVPRCPSVLSILLDSSRPMWFLFQSTRMLSRFSTRSILFQSLLLFPDIQEQSQDYTRLPHVERMCSLLIDSSRTGDEADGIKRHILTFFAMLSEAHPTAHAIIIESQSVIPSIIVYLYELSAPVWQGDEAMESDSQAASRVIQRMNQTTFLLHHLMFKAEASLSLRERLERAPRHYNGLVHLFVVIMGRLSFADVPEWVQEEDKQDLERVAGLAKDLLELLIGAPEMDAIWATYQEGPDEEMEDDEEVEARRLAANVI
ncbi:hypothetical protein EDB19DRAFT_1716897 [Suillus lakei]|nr:hypothetical protein EDB19DRAFT_1716897 [Suillus lakei]